MRFLTCGVLAVALGAMLFAFLGAPDGVRAQQPKIEAPRAGYAELEQASRRLLAAYASGDASKLWDCLAAPRKNGVALSLARTIKSCEEQPERMEKFKKRLETLDPAGKQKISTIEDLRALSPANFFALCCGMNKAAASEPVVKAFKAQWYMVEREMGLTQLRELRGFTEMVSRGYVRFENLEGQKVVVQCMPDDDGWRIIAFEVQAGDFRFGFTGKLAIGGGAAWTEGASSEARAALGAMKDRARVVYQRNPNRAVDKAALGLGRTELVGQYFTDDSYAVVNTDARNWVATCKALNTDGPILAVVADITTGTTKFIEYEDELEMQLNPPKLEEKK